MPVYTFECPVHGRQKQVHTMKEVVGDKTCSSCSRIVTRVFDIPQTIGNPVAYRDENRIPWTTSELELNKQHEKQYEAGWAKSPLGHKLAEDI